eukprot:4896025-Amphidinium_carterae.1
MFAVYIGRCPVEDDYQVAIDASEAFINRSTSVTHINRFRVCTENTPTVKRVLTPTSDKPNHKMQTLVAACLMSIVIDATLQPGLAPTGKNT